MARKSRPTASAESAVPKASGAQEVGFPIVGLGASAGGLEAFEEFFRHVPVDSGIAFVLVSHLDPDRASLLKEILQRDTAMPVVEATDQMQLTPNRVHLIPPNREMAIFQGTLQLSVPDLPRGHRMPIDADATAQHDVDPHERRVLGDARELRGSPLGALQDSNLPPPGS